MLKSIRYRLLAWFLAFVFLTAGFIIPAGFIYHAQEKEITKVTQDIHSLYVDFLKDSKSVNDFLTFEQANTGFFIKGESPYLSYHLKVSHAIGQNLQSLRNSPQTRSFGISDRLNTIAAHLIDYNNMVDSLVYLVYKRGYSNSGLEGELLDYGQLIENAPGLTDQQVYQLRKIENDYFSHYDTSDVAAFRKLVPLLRDKLLANERLPSALKERTINLINSYSEAFLRLAELDKLTGIRKNLALRASLNTKVGHIESQFDELSFTSLIVQKSLIGQLKGYYVLSMFLIFLMAIVFSYLASKRIVFHLETLTSYISVLSRNHLSNSPPINLRNSALEIRQIYHEFRNLFSLLKIRESQRNKALKRAEDTQHHYQELADMLPQSIFETDTLGNYTYVNKAWHHAFGFTPDDLHEGLNLIETLISESNQNDILGQSKIENSNFIAIRKNGSRFPASVFSDNIMREGNIAGRRGIIIDITERTNYIRSLQQETNKAKTSDELKSSFLANMSHEIRTPMNSIIGFSNLLASDQIPETQKKDFTNYIRTSSEILLNLVDDIIDIAKIEAGELKIVKKDCELNKLGNELLTVSREALKKFNKHHLQLIFKPDLKNPETALKTDPFRLRQILVNLINNAIKFTENGWVEFGYTIKDESLVEFYVKDTGLGLSREELDFIFERFKRSRHSVETNIAGTGLGLAISKNLVQMLGGEMWVDSTIGQGTTFLFTLPYLRSTVLPVDKTEQQENKKDFNWENKTILIAEDDIQSFHFLRELLNKTRAEIIHARTGREAVEIVRSTDKIDLVIMDIQLPEINGLEATKLIKMVRSNLPVIAQTAYAMAGDREKMEQAGCNDYIAKPVDISQLFDIVNHFLMQEKSTLQQKLTPTSH